MAAAVADYRPAAPRADKLKKDAAEAIELRLERTDDVVSALAEARRPDQVLVGFAAETGERAVGYGRDKLARKGLDAVVVNDVSTPGIAFEAADNEVVIVTRGQERHIPRAPKRAVAAAILDAVLTLRSASPLKVGG
jgi:phosphopantothenoylcysteine decarboxylase/phosphopantothenate--cysteine ligase